MTVPQAPARFTADELEAAIASGETIEEFAARKGVTTAWAAARLRKAKIARGEMVKAANDFSWQDKLRFQPAREAVERLYRTHGREAVEERWGRDIGRMRKLRPAQ